MKGGKPPVTGHRSLIFAIVRLMRTMTSTELYLRLLGHVKPYWRVLVLGILGMTVVAATWAFAPKWRLSALASYVSDQYMDNDEGNTLGVKIPSYTLADLKLAWHEGGWRLSAAVNDLFNEKYYNYAVRSQIVPDRYSAYPLPERNFMVAAEYTFR